jgi:ABC-type glycerol-3-phosphate transport system substrate-binding protein
MGGPINAAQCRSGVIRSIDDYTSTPIGYGANPDQAWFDVYNQALVEMQKVDSVTYGVPCEGAYTFVIYYNKDQFEAQSVTPPKTWTEMIAVADKFKAVDIAPFTLCGVWSYYMHWWLFTLAQRTAGADAVINAMYKEKEALWNQPDILLAAQEIQTLRDGGYFVDGFQGLDHIGSHMEFISGNAAMDYVGTWFPGEMGGSIPADFNYASFPFPAYEGGKGDPTFAQLWANNIFVTSFQRIPEAVDYVKWWSSDIVQDMQAEMTGTVSARAGSQCPEVQTGACEQVANAQGIAGYEFDIYTFDAKLETAYQQAGVRFFFGEIDAAGYMQALDDAKAAYFKSIEG